MDGYEYFKVVGEGGVASREHSTLTNEKKEQGKWSKKD